MYLNYKYRLYPNKQQKSKLEQQFFASNQAYNYALKIRMQDIHDKNGFTDKNLIYKYVRTELTEREVAHNTGVIQQSIIHLDNELKKYFNAKKKGNTVKGFPRFVSSSFEEQSFEFKNQGVSFDSKNFKIMRMNINWKYHRELPSRPKKIVVKRESDGNYYVIFSVKIEKESFKKTGVDCAIDMNVNNIAIAESTGEVYLKTIKKLSKYSKKYQKLQKILSRRYENARKTKTKISKNTKKIQKKQNKIHKKVKNVKEDFFHKCSLNIVKNFDHIRVEKLNVKDMKQNAPSKRLRRDIAEVSWGSFIEKLRYKAERYGKVFEQIDPAYTSQRCNSCGCIDKRNRKSQSVFKCIECGYEDNADKNAAKNILDYEQWFLVQKTRYASRHAESS